AAAVYLINRIPTLTFGLSSPYEKLFCSHRNYTKLHIFGCLCYPWLRPYSAHKLDSRSIPCVFLGYSLTQSVYLCLDPSTSKIYISRHIKFVEHIFPFTSLQTHISRPSLEIISKWFPPVSTVPTSSLPLTIPLPTPSLCYDPTLCHLLVDCTTQPVD
ncbi:hypothetical protein PanWU01x14_045380, partial [Parasponia andersonii]